MITLQEFKTVDYILWQGLAMKLNEIKKIPKLNSVKT